MTKTKEKKPESKEVISTEIKEVIAIENTVASFKHDESVKIIMLPISGTVKEETEFDVTGEMANILINKGFAKQK